MKNEVEKLEYYKMCWYAEKCTLELPKAIANYLTIGIRPCLF